MLGKYLIRLEEYEKAAAYYTELKAIWEEMGQLEMGQLEELNCSSSQLGSCYSSMEQYHKAIEMYERCKVLCQQLGQRENEGVQLSELASTTRPCCCMREHAAIEEETGNRCFNCTMTLPRNLGDCYCCLGQYDKAIALLEQYKTAAAENDCPSS